MEELFKANRVTSPPKQTPIVVKSNSQNKVLDQAKPVSISERPQNAQIKKRPSPTQDENSQKDPSLAEAISQISK